ncbi:MAG: MarR family transcriptional regulator [Cyanobacteria bacterium P01_A01_bin.123]
MVSQRFTLKDPPKYEALLALARRYPELDIAAVETCCAFLRTATSVYTVLDNHFADHELSMGKFTLLMLLFSSETGGLTPSDCADLAGITRATVTGLLDGLTREGWVERKTHPDDRRRLIIVLTAQGTTLLDQMLPRHFRLTTDLLQALSEDEKVQFQTLLQKLRDGALGLTEAGG